MTPSAKKRDSRFKFVTDIIAELKKAVWPTRQEALRLTGMVLIVCLAAGLILGGFDFGFFHLVNWLR